jgi:Siphovirus Gp157
MSDEPRGPGPTTIELAVGAWQRARAGLAADPDLADDENAILAALNADPNAIAPDDLLRRIVRALTFARLRTDESQQLAAMMQARKTRYARRVETLRAELFDLMQIFERVTFRAPEGTVSIKAGAPGLEVTDQDKLPDEYMVVTRAPNLRLILDDLKQGVVIDGAMLTNGPPTLAIRRSRAPAGEIDDNQAPED